MISMEFGEILTMLFRGHDNVTSPNPPPPPPHGAWTLPRSGFIIHLHVHVDVLNSFGKQYYLTVLLLELEIYNLHGYGPSGP